MGESILDKSGIFSCNTVSGQGGEKLSALAESYTYGQDWA